MANIRHSFLLLLLIESWSRAFFIMPKEYRWEMVENKGKSTKVELNDWHCPHQKKAASLRFPGLEMKTRLDEKASLHFKVLNSFSSLVAKQEDYGNGRSYVCRRSLMLDRVVTRSRTTGNLWPAQWTPPGWHCGPCHGWAQRRNICYQKGN